jgi:hypothetical protein
MSVSLFLPLQQTNMTVSVCLSVQHDCVWVFVSKQHTVPTYFRRMEEMCVGERSTERERERERERETE